MTELGVPLPDAPMPDAPQPDAPPSATVPPDLPYHRLYRATPGYRWWRPLVALLLLALFALLGTFIVVTIGLLVGLSTGDVTLETAQQDLATLDAGSPFALLIGLGSVAIWLPAVPLALLCAGIRPIGLVHSVLFRLRGHWMLACLGPAAAVMVVTMVVSFLIFPIFDGEGLGPVTTEPVTLLLSALVIVLVVPFQAAAEEYVFRGVLTQVIGSWLRWVPFALVIPTVLFAFGHIYDVWGLLDVAAFGIGAAIITWRTGGLEAAIVLHALNNVAIFLVLATGALGTTVVESDAGSPAALGLTVVTTAGYVLWIDRLATRRGLPRVAVARAVPGIDTTGIDTT